MSEVKRARHRDDRSENASKRLALIAQRQENWHFIFTIANSTFEQCNAGAVCSEMVIEQSNQAKEAEDAVAMPPPLSKPTKSPLPLIRKRIVKKSSSPLKTASTNFIIRKNN